MSRLVLVGMLAFGSISPTFTTKAFLGRPTFDQEIYDEYQAELDAIDDWYNGQRDMYNRFIDNCNRRLEWYQEQIDNLREKKANHPSYFTPHDQWMLDNYVGRQGNYESRIRGSINYYEGQLEWIRDERRRRIERAHNRYIDRQYGHDHEDWGIY